MKKGTCAMAGFAVSTLQRFITRGLFCFDPATILRLYCLTLAFVFFGTVGAIAQTAVAVVKLGDTVVDKVYPGAVVTLDGSGSTADSPGRTITVYSWFESTNAANNCASPLPETTRSPKVEGPPEVPTAAQLTFTAPDLAPGAADVKYCWFLRVENSAEDISGFAPVNVIVSHSVAPPPAANKPPISNAGPDQTIKPGRTVTLDGTGSTDDDHIANYSWNRTGGTCTVTTVFGGVSSLTGTNALPSFTAETLASGVASCTHDFILFVTDNDGVLGGTGDSVTVTIIATAENQPPIARGGANQTVESGATVTLDGSLSSDDGSIVRYTWFQASTGTTPALSDNNVAKPTLTAPIVAAGSAAVKFSYGLRVEDDDGSVSMADTVEITVTPVPTDTTAPTGAFETAPATHDGMTPFNMAVVFSEPVVGFTIADIQLQPLGIPADAFARDFTPTSSNFRQDPTNALRYTFTVTPIAPYNIWVTSVSQRMQKLLTTYDIV